MEPDDFDNSSSWISTKALREAADIKKAVKSAFHRKSASVLPPTSQILAIPPVTIEIPLSNQPKVAHHRYNTTCLDNIQSPRPAGNEFSFTEKKYQLQISRLNEEIQILSEQLKQANEIISQLSQKINEQISKHTLHLQALQERHEQKLKRCHQEIEFLISSSETYRNNEIDKLCEKHRIELSKQQDFFENKIFLEEQHCLEELNKRENDHKSQMNMVRRYFIDMMTGMKTKFLEELEYIQNKYKNKIYFIKNLHRKSGGCEVDEEGSTVGEVDFEKTRQKEHGFSEENSACSKDQILLKIPQGQNDIDSSIMQLLNQLNVSLESC
ncbi:hypothetical protein SteCoe_5082 [Stentor coeruleus]|uniref:Uncharacterized protein n=1 Tax=Stentor coeruleus TaxID=5963 RepID=A0A1R2CT72_9CILI|nr:hypothetical protein SteCoe_5082 [Stentor coeruleus]